VKSTTIVEACLLAGLAICSTSVAQTNNYSQTNLVSNVPGLALTVDVDLVHPWGMAVSSGQPFRIAANGRGKFKSYDATGAPQDPRAIIAVPAGVTSPANPTAVAANTTPAFTPSTSPLPSPFLFATRQGTISGEYADGRGDILTTTILVVNHSSQGAEYTGLAVLAPDCCGPYLAVADFHRGYIETFTSFFAPLGIPGAFTDPNLPANYAPWNLSVAGNRVFVTYALQDSAQHDPVIGAGNGIIDIYNLDGSFVKRFASNGVLNVPSGVVQADSSFGAFSNDILVGNFGDGVINAFDPSTGAFLGSLKDGNGNVLVNPELHTMVFGDGNTANSGTLFLTAGLQGGTNGIFASIKVNSSGAGPDFTISSAQPSMAVLRGQPATFPVTASPVGTFRSAFSFACNAPAGVTCNIGSQSVDPVTGAVSVNVTATPSTSGTAAVAAAAFTFPGTLLVAAFRFRKRRSLVGILLSAAGLLILTVAGTTGCGSGYGAQMSPQSTTQSITVVASTGSVTNSQLLTLVVQ